jgi:hypothetical protein
MITRVYMARTTGTLHALDQGMMPIDINTAESLRNFAIANGEIQFAHLVTAAINGEGWAVARIRDVLTTIAQLTDNATRGQLEGDELRAAVDSIKLTTIAATDTLRPGGLVARGGFEF